MKHILPFLLIAMAWQTFSQEPDPKIVDIMRDEISGLKISNFSDEALNSVKITIDDRPFSLKYPEAKIYYFQNGRLIKSTKADPSKIWGFDVKSFDNNKGHGVIFIQTKKSNKKTEERIYPKISINGKVSSYKDLENLNSKEVISFHAVHKKGKSELIIKTK